MASLFFVSILLVLLATLPGLVDFVFQKKFPTRRGGHVLVTGASTGIGRDAVDALLLDGYTVWAGVRKGTDVEKITAVGNDRLHAIKLDVVDQESIDAAYDTVISNLGDKPLSGIVLNAGLGGLSPIEFHEMESAKTIYNVNVFGALAVTQKFLPQIRKDKGRIVFVSSLLGKFVSSPLGIYSSSKYAMEGIADGLRMELGPLDVSVSVVEPGVVETPFHGTAKDAHEPTTEAQRVYPHLFSKAKEEFGVKAMEKAAKVSEVSPAIVHAISSTTPKTRYQVANILGIPGWVVIWVRWATTDRIFDMLMA